MAFADVDDRDGLVPDVAREPGDEPDSALFDDGGPELPFVVYEPHWTHDSRGYSA